MQRFIEILIATLMITSSQASTRLTNGERYLEPSLTVAQPQTATPKGPAHARIPRIAKPKLFRSNPHRAVYYATATDQDDDIGIDDDDKISGYRRRDLQKIQTDTTPDNPEGLSEDIRWRLFLARQAALIKHREAHS